MCEATARRCSPLQRRMGMFFTHSRLSARPESERGSRSLSRPIGRRKMSALRLDVDGGVRLLHYVAAISTARFDYFLSGSD